MLLAHFGGGELLLFSTSEGLEVIHFERQTQEYSAVAWADNISGDFITANSKVGALRLWNASMESPKEIIKVSPLGIVSICPLQADKAVFLL